MVSAHEFPCKQHSNFRSATQRRKHINLLLLDGCEDYSRTYGLDGLPREEASILWALSRPSQHASGRQPGQVSTLTRAKQLWQSAYVEGGQEAADLAKQVAGKRSPCGACFGLANPGLTRAVPPVECVPNMKQPNMTQVSVKC
jgi:hypothetical protein